MLRFIALLCFVAMVSPHSVHAVFVPRPQGAASAGVFERPIEREFGPMPVAPCEAIPLFEIDVPEEQFCMEDDATVRIERVEFIGNDVFSTEQLQNYLCHYCEEELSMEDLQCLCQDIQNLYVREGYILARAYLPEQEIVEGTLVVRILEGNIGHIFVRGNCYYGTHFIRSYVAQYENCPVNYHELLKALLLLNEFEDLCVTCVFAKSEAFGCTDLILNVEDCNPIHEYISYNNFGVPHTPINRIGVRLDYGNLLFYGDTFSCVGVVGTPVNRVRFMQAEYYVPLNRRGLWLETSYLRADFHIDKFPRLDVEGQSEIANITLHKELIRTRTLSTDCFVSFDYKRVRNFSLHQLASIDNLRVLGLGYWLEYSDRFLGRTWIEFDTFFGLANFMGGSKDVDPKSSRLGAGGEFVIGNLYFTRVQKLPLESYLILNFAGQMTKDRLPLVEQFYIGGWDTVRGYHTAEALGDTGYYFNCELRTAPPYVADCAVSCYMPDVAWRDFLQLVAFIDTGSVHLKRSGKVHSKTETLTGAGVGVRIYGPGDLNLSIDVGFPIKHGHGHGAQVYVKLDWNFL